MGQGEGGGAPQKEFCIRGHVIGDNPIIRRRVIRGKLYVQRECRPCHNLWSHRKKDA